MQQSILTKIKLFILRNRQNRIFRKFVQVLCCMVVFVTTYALILPAITMEQDAFCGKEAHEHTEECLQPVPVPVLVCTQESLGIHTHSGSCYNADGAVICGQADYVVHSHSGSCYDAAGQLVCLLPERSSHVHGESCYIPGETQPEILHVHSEACYIQEQGELTCTEEEREGHSHGDQCYGPGDLLECTLTEHHVHDASCYSLPLTCSISTEPHVHSENCYGTGNLQCSTPEYHTHTDSCWDRTLSCNETDETHCHDDGCYTANLRCQIPENHAHSSSCYESILVCGKEAGQAHEHNDSCYGTEPQLQCRMPENHVHDTGCYNRILNCEVPEDPGHRHEDACYQWNSVLNCGLEEGQPEPMEPPEPVLACTEPEAPVHVHGDSCFELQEKTCLGGEDHQHTDSCYTCGLEAHAHTLICYSDPDADVESSEVWKATFAHVTLTGDWPTDVVAIAETQLGYTESTRNYDVWEDNSIHGYTRYGAWYGAPHGDWCGMFASFCLNYAEVKGMPHNYGVRPWIEDLTKLGLYYTAKETKAQKGNLIFFDWDADGLSDHVGIVAEVQEPQEHTGASVKTIEGNSGNAVRYQHYDPNDPVILGYGLLPGQERIPLPEVEEEYHINMDINMGPVVTITAQEDSEEDVLKEAEGSVQIMKFATPRNGSKPLTEYLTTVANSKIVFTLTNMDNTPIPKDTQGNYIVTASTSYKLTMRIESPNGFVPGTYTYQLPDGLAIVGGTGKLVANNIDMGSWTVSNDGFITFVFNNNANKHSNVKLSAEMSVTFTEADSFINFADQVKVEVHPPESSLPGTEVVKFGQQGNGSALMPDDSKIYWTIHAKGHEGSKIPGSVLVDRIDPNSPAHSYTDSDIAAGLYIGVSAPDGTWREWTVHVDDPSLTWDENGWEFTMPEIYNGVQLGNENWEYYIKYTSTPANTNETGEIGYMNTVLVDNVTKGGWAGFTAQVDPAGIVKTGNFVADESGGSFRWKITAKIPGYVPGTVPEYNWYVSDEMFIDGDTHVPVLNNIDQAQITATYNGQTIPVPNHSNGNAAVNPIVWQTDYKSSNGNYCNIRFFSRCECTENSCKYWGGNGCGAKVDGVSSDYCLCWTITEPVTIEIVYETNDANILKDYVDKKLVNRAELHNIRDYVNDVPDIANRGTVVEEVKIPSMFNKQITKDFDGYIAKYTIVLNEAKLNLSPDGSPITIIDEMTDSLVYIGGSMVITTEDAAGNTDKLTYGTDYTLSYDGTSHDNNTHVLTIVINNPQPVQYTLDYDTTLIVPDEVGSEGIHYSNSATVTIWGKELSADSQEKVHANINVTAQSYKVQIIKRAAENNALLPDAVYGLFNENGGLITTQTTGADGTLLFETNVIDSIILREHEPCYIQEISAPDGFVLDNTKYWFYFCDSGDTCTKGNSVKDQHPNAIRLPGDKVGVFNLTNVMMGYELPSTGGTGYELYTVGGTLLMLAALILLYSQRKCRKEDIYSS